MTQEENKNKKQEHEERKTKVYIFVVELLFDEAYLTLKEVFKIAYKFILPTKLLVLSSKN